MAQKPLTTKNRKVDSVTLGRVRTPAAPSAESRPIVLVGPYRADQMKKWILPKGYYNYPVGKDDDCTPENCKRIRELWLYKGKSERKVFSAEFIGVKTRAELPDYPATKTKPHGEKYLLFKVAELYGPQLENATVHVRVSDFTKRTPKIAAAIKAFQEGSKAKPKSAKHLQALGAASILAEVLPGEIAQVPPERLCVREEGLQLSIWSPVKGMAPQLEKIESIVASITEFGFGRSMPIAKAYRYLCAHAGLDFLDEHYSISRCYSDEMIDESLSKVCRAHGGNLR